jgi:dihydroorotase
MRRMALWIRNGRVIDPYQQLDEVLDVLVRQEGIELRPSQQQARGAQVIDAHGWWVLPGLIDLQVHFRQPGFEEKETIASGTQAALAGGITSVVVMPNTRPTIDTPEHVRFQQEEARRAGGLELMVAAAVTKGLLGKDLTDHGALKAAGAVAITDDGLPVMDDDLMREALRNCRAHGLLFMQHAEDLRLSQHAPLTSGDAQKHLGLEGQPADAEGVMVERDVAMALETGARYHVLHTSTARSLRAIRQAKDAGGKVSCEASPHHLLLTDRVCWNGDPNTKMNPPLRCESDRQALVEALRDGTVDAVATDHAPHTEQEKQKGFKDAPFGVVGLETAFPALLSFVHDGTITVEHAVRLMTSGPARVLGREGELGTLASTVLRPNLCLVDPERSWEVTKDTLHGRSKNSAFLGRTFRGRVLATILDGTLRHQLNDVDSNARGLRS